MLELSCCRISLGSEPGVEALFKKVGVATGHLDGSLAQVRLSGRWSEVQDKDL